MSQNDFSIANQGFPSFRSDLNSALQALASNSAGATEPSTTYAYQWWYDTSTDILKQRNSDNDAWISIGSFDQATDEFFPFSGGVSVQTQLDAKLSSTNPTITGTPVEDIYTISGTSVSLEPDNGSVQVHTLTGNTTYTDAFSAGQAITLMIDDGTAYTITWPTMTWVNNKGSAPTLATSGYTVVALWKVSTTLYGALVGDGS